MAYFRTKNPAFPARLGAYVAATNPAFPQMSDFVSPNAGTSCPCTKKRKRRRLGQLAPDGSDDNFGVPIGIADFSAPTVPYPALPSSGAVYIPSGAETSLPGDASPIAASPVPNSSGFITVLNNPSVSTLLNGQTITTTAASATSPIGTLSTGEVILGGLGVVAAFVLLAGKKGR